MCVTSGKTSTSHLSSFPSIISFFLFFKCYRWIMKFILIYLFLFIIIAYSFFFFLSWLFFILLCYRGFGFSISFQNFIYLFVLTSLYSCYTKSCMPYCYGFEVLGHFLVRLPVLCWISSWSCRPFSFFLSNPFVNHLECVSSISVCTIYLV